MEISTSKMGKGLATFVIIFFLAVLPSIFILGDIFWGSSGISGSTVVALLLILVFSPVIVLYCINDLFFFVIDEKGITRKLPEYIPKKLRGGEIFIAWDEMKEIGVGERQCS